jgi:hypothetical protein
LISLLSKRLSRLRMRPVSGWDFARNSLRELIPLLFRCYSAVIPLLVPLLFRCYLRCHSAVSVGIHPANT